MYMHRRAEARLDGQVLPLPNAAFPSKYQARKGDSSDSVARFSRGFVRSRKRSREPGLRAQVSGPKSVYPAPVDNSAGSHRKSAADSDRYCPSSLHEQGTVPWPILENGRDGSRHRSPNDRGESRYPRPHCRSATAPAGMRQVARAVCYWHRPYERSRARPGAPSNEGGDESVRKLRSLDKQPLQGFLRNVQHLASDLHLAAHQRRLAGDHRYVARELRRLQPADAPPLAILKEINIELAGQDDAQVDFPVSLVEQQVAFLVPADLAIRAQLRDLMRRQPVIHIGREIAHHRSPEGDGSNMGGPGRLGKARKAIDIFDLEIGETADDLDLEIRKAFDKSPLAAIVREILDALEKLHLSVKQSAEENTDEIRERENADVGLPPGSSAA